VRVAVLVAEHVVAAVVGDPPGHRALDGEAAGHGKADAQRALGLERAMREVAVVADGDAVPADRVEDDRDQDVVPRQAVAPEDEAGGADGKERYDDEDPESDLLPPRLELRRGDLLERTGVVTHVVDRGQWGVEDGRGRGRGQGVFLQAGGGGLRNRNLRTRRWVQAGG